MRTVIGLIILSLSLAGCASVSQWLASQEAASEPSSEAVATNQPTPLPIDQGPFNVFDLGKDSQVVGKLRKVQVGKDDTLLDIARRYDLGFDEIAAANPEIDVWLPGEGKEVLVPTQFVLPPVSHTGIVINVATRRLYYFPKNKSGKVTQVITYPIGIGRDGWATPIGDTKVIAKEANPSWQVPISIRQEHAKKGEKLPAVVPPGPDNPLGLFAFRLDIPSYLIHGTNKPYGIGMRVSHGCVQLYPEDIESLYKQVPVGTPVQIINRPHLAGWRDGQLYLEVHYPLEEDANNKLPLAKVLKAEIARAVKLAPKEAKPVDDAKVHVAVERHLGYPLPISRDSASVKELLASVTLVAQPPDRHGIDKIIASTAKESAGDKRAGWFIQAGSFRDENGAKRRNAVINNLPHPRPFQIVADDTFHRVLSGPYSSREEAQRHVRTIDQKLGLKTIVVHSSSVPAG